MLLGLIDPSALNAKTTINPQDFINSDFTTPGSNLDLSPTDEDGNPVIRSFDRSLAYLSAEKEESDTAAEDTEASAESTTEPAAEATTEVQTVEKNYWKEGEEYTNFLSIIKAFDTQIQKKTKDFTLNVSISTDTIKTYRESTWKVLNKEEKDAEEDERSDSELVQAMVLESFLTWKKADLDKKTDDEIEEELLSALETSEGLSEKEIAKQLKEQKIEELTQETKEDEILEGRFYTTLHYEPVYEGEEKAAEATTKTTKEETSETKKAEATTEATKKETSTEKKKATNNENLETTEKNVTKDNTKSSTQEANKNEVSFDQQQEIDNVIVRVKAPKGAFPKNSTLKVTKVTDKKLKKSLIQAVDDNDKTIVKSLAYDISILNKDGKEIEPDITKGQVKVSFKSKDVKDSNLETDVWHITDKMEATTLPIDIKKDTATTTTNSFSYYVVNFGYNDKSYEMSSDEEIELSSLISKVGLSGVVSLGTSSNPDKLQLRQDGDVWYVKPIGDFSQAETLTVTIDDTDYEINVTASGNWDKFAILFEDGTLAFVNKDRNLDTLTKQYGNVEHKYLVSETGYRYDWSKNANEIKHVIFLDKISPVDTSGWFANCSNLIDVENTENLDMSKVETTRFMFVSCSSLTRIDASNWNVGNVTDMQSMFRGCSSFESLNLSGWDFSKITSINSLSGFISGLNLNTFVLHDCNFSGLTTLSNFLGITGGHVSNLDLSGSDFSKLTTLYQCFAGNSALNTIDLSDCDFSNVTSLMYTFVACSNLQKVYTNGLDIRKATDMSYMFNGCSALTQLDLNNLDVSNVTNMSYMFLGCSSLKQLDINNWNVSNITNMYGMFIQCSSLIQLDMDNWDLSHVKDMTNMFNGCSSLKSLDLSSCHITGLTIFPSYLVQGCSSLEYLNLSGFDLTHDTASGANTSGFFSSCSNLKRLDMNNWKLPYASMSYFFISMSLSSSNLAQLNFKNWEFTKATSLSNMFTPWGSSEYSVNLDGWKFPNVTSLSGMFQVCGVGKISMKDWDTAKVTNMSNMFNGCTSLTQLDVSDWNTVNVTDMSSMFQRCTSLKRVILDKWNVSSLYSMPSSMFNGCSSLEYINLDNWNLLGLSSNRNISFGGFLYNCPNLQKIDMNNWKIYLQNLNYLFAGITNSEKLLTFNVKNWNLYNVQYVSQMFAGIDCECTINLGRWYYPNLHSFDSMFQGCHAKIINFEHWDTSQITDFHYMFAGCNFLESLDLRDWNTSRASNIQSMFEQCYKLKFLGVSGWDLSSIDSLNNLNKCFYDCNSLKVLDLNNWTLSGLHKFSLGYLGVFNCSNLKTLKMDYVNLEHVPNLTGAFTCSYNISIENLYLNHLNIGQAECLNNMFNGTGYKHVYANYLYIPEVLEINYMFSGCYKLETVGLNSPTLIDWFDSKGVFGYQSVFSGCENLKDIEMSNWIFDSNDNSLSTFSNMFTNCNSLEKMNFSNCEFNNVKAFSNFSNITGLNSCNSEFTIIMNSCDFPDVITFSEMFKNCQFVKRIEMDNINAPEILSISEMFSSCKNLKNLIFTHNNEYFSKLATTVSMFSDCTSLNSLELRLFSSPLRNTSYMFKGCESLKSVNLETLDVSKVTEMSSMFRDCRSITSFNFGTFNTQNVYDMSHMFDGCESLKDFKAIKFNTSFVENMSYMFKDCKSLLSIDLKDFSTENLMSLVSMFEGCTSLNDVSINTFDISKIRKFDRMFHGCESLTYLDISDWSDPSVTSMKDFLTGSGLHRIKLGKDFEFYKESDILPYQKWMNIDTKKVYTLWSEYTGGDMAGTYIAEGYAVELTPDNVDEISYDEKTNKVVAYVDSEEGKTPTVISFLDLFTQSVKLSADLVNANDKLKEALAKNFSTKELLLTLKNRTYADIVGCSKQEKVLWTFDIPKNNKSVITLEIFKNKTEKVGYIKNSKEALDIFTFYDSDGKVIEVLKPNVRHSYKDLGYVGSYDTEEYDSHLVKKVVHHESTYYGGNIQDMTDDKLENKIYPEYSSYLTYDSSMNNYEVPISPGHYEIDSSISSFEDIYLTPSKLTTKTVAKIENGKPLLDENKKPVTETLTLSYDYINGVDLSNPNIVIPTFTLFNHIYKKTKNYYENGKQEFSVFKKTDTSGTPLEGAIYRFTSLSSGDSFTDTTDINGEIEYYEAEPGEIFKVEEIHAPAGYLLNKSAETIIFTKSSTLSKFLYSEEAVYDDGVSIVSNYTNKCYVCQEYSQCTCKDFGDSKCNCCGLPSQHIYTSYEYVTQQDKKKNSVHLSKQIDSSVTSYVKNHTYFIFKIYDNEISDTNPVKTIKLYGDTSDWLRYDFIDGHEYTITEEKFVPDYYLPEDDTVYPNTSAMNSLHDWTDSSNISTNTGNLVAQSYNSITFTYFEEFVNGRDDGYYKVTFTNHHNIFKHNLTVSKTVNSTINDKVDESKDFNFNLNLKNVTLDLSDYKITYKKSDGTTGEVVLDDEGNFNFTLKHNQNIEFEGIPDVTDYKVTEDKYYNYHTEKTNDNGKILGSDIMVSFKNTEVNPGSLKLIKKDGNKFLPGVTFSLTQEDGSEVGTKTTDENGEVLFEDLEEGTYTVTETKTTNGHSLLAKPFTVTIPFTIKKEDAEKQKVDTSTATLMGDTYYFYDLVYTVKNDAAPNLPKTGNKETRYLFLILAIAAIVFVEYYLTVTKKKEER